MKPQSLLSEEEVRALYAAINDTQAPYPRNQTVIALFEQQARRTPERRAVIMGEQQLTYRELDRLAGQLAGRLVDLGIGPGSIVAILADRSLEMMVATYAVLKSGAAYLPLSPANPAKRNLYMLEDSQAAMLLKEPSLTVDVSWHRQIVVDLEDDALRQREAISSAQSQLTSEDPMYVIYTSGTTGRPKGVIVSHTAAVNRLHWMQRLYPLHEEDVILQKTPYLFDVSVWELFWWGMSGASVALLAPGAEKLPQYIIDAVQRYRVTVLHFVPSMLGTFLNYAAHPDDWPKLSSIHRLFCSGEALTAAHANKFGEVLGSRFGCKLTNLYGPTEATVDVTSYDCSLPLAAGQSVPIGRPIDNIRMYILQDGVLQPPGQTGELVIAGTGLAIGYLNHPVGTSERFVVYPQLPEERVYRTGDLARLLPDGNIEFLGRIDTQIKIRGLRIELGEIEAAVREFPDVEQCIVAVKQGDSLNPRLCAYFTTAVDVPVQELQQHLQRCLPAYMIPVEYYPMERFPLTANGKADRRALLSL